MKSKPIYYPILKGIFNVLIITVGNLLLFLRPKRAREISENGMTLVFNNNLSIPDRLMRGAIFKKLSKTRDHSKIAEIHRTFWIKKGKEWFSGADDLFESDFIPNCSFLIELLKEDLSNQSEKFNTVIEIGTGNGKLLKYLSSEFPEIDHFIGIDLSPAQIKRNNKKFKKEKKLEFVAADGFDWIMEHGQGNTIFVTSGGVLEYFTEIRLKQLLKEINLLGKIFFVAIEPNSTQHNFETDPHSQVYGSEWSFSHNYPKVFKDAGFNVWHFSQQPWFEGTNIRTFIGAKN